VIVVDTSVLVYLLLPGERTEQSERVFRRDPVWAAPRLWRSEFRNVLAVYMRRGPLALDQALQLMDTSNDDSNRPLRGVTALPGPHLYEAPSVKRQNHRATENEANFHFFDDKPLGKRENRIRTVFRRADASTRLHHTSVEVPSSAR
jgi:PIN domain